MKTKILLLGAHGMLGQSVAHALSHASHIVLYTAARHRADFTFDATKDEELVSCFNEVSPDICINAAALVSLDACEQDQAMAYRVNARLPERLAALCRAKGTYFVHISTDHYYCGDGRKKHTETMPVILLNEYARTKYAGECFAKTYRNALILRTNIVGFRGDTMRPTFLEWLINTMKEKKPMVLFEDFFTSSLHTEQFSHMLLKLLALRPTGIFHLASSTVSSKEEFACAIGKKIFHSIPVYERGSVRALSTQRADSLGLSTKKIERVLGCQMPSLDEVADSIFRAYRQGEYAI